MLHNLSPGTINKDTFQHEKKNVKKLEICKAEW